MTSRFLTTARSKTEINRIRPKVTQAERAKLDSKDLIKLRSLAVEPLHNMFELPTYSKDEDLLENTHNINSIIDDFVKRLQYYDMHDAFEILRPSDYQQDGTFNSPKLTQMLPTKTSPVTSPKTTLHFRWRTSNCTSYSFVPMVKTMTFKVSTGQKNFSKIAVPTTFARKSTIDLRNCPLV